MQTVQLRMPSVAEVAVEECSGTPTPDGRVTLLGRVVDADGNPVPGAAVRILWSTGFALVGGGVRSDREGVAIFADERGAFLQCGVPVGSVEVQAIVDGVESPIRSVPVPVGARVVTTTAVLSRSER
jgi:hypothetical protein